MNDNHKRARTTCNFYVFAENKELFGFTKQNRIKHGFEGSINRNNITYQYKISLGQDEIYFELGLPIVCRSSQTNIMLGYLIEVNLIFKDRGVFFIDKHGAIRIEKTIPCKYFAPSIEMLEYSFYGLLISATEFFGTIDAIATGNTVPDDGETSSCIYYDVYKKNYLIQAMDNQMLRMQMSFTRPSFDDVIKDVDETINRIKEKDEDESDEFDYLKDYGNE